MPRPFRVGLIGTGNIAQGVHIPGWRKLPDAQIVAVADLNEAAAREAAAQAGGAEVFTDVNALMKLDLDAVDICTPTQTHLPVALAALRSGKHVLCEKPLAVTAREVARLGHLAESQGLVLMTAQHHRFTAISTAIKEWVDQGNLGDVYHARVCATRRAWLPPRAGFIDRALSGGGPCLDIGVHALDLTLWLMGFPKSVRVTGTTKVNFAKGHTIPGKWGEWDRQRFSVEDFAAGFVHFENGATLSIEASWLGHQVADEDMSSQLFGLKGGVKWPSGEFASTSGRALVQGTVSSPDTVESPYAAEIAAFYHAAVHGRPSPVPWTGTIEVIRILEAIYASQASGREVRLKRG